MSDLVEFEDLADLDGNDLRAVLDQVSSDQVVEALAALTPERCRLLLAKLPPESVARLEVEVAARGAVSMEAAQAAQRALVDIVCRLGRAGQIAFDDPDDFD